MARNRLLMLLLSLPLLAACSLSAGGASPDPDAQRPVPDVQLAPGLASAPYALGVTVPLQAAVSNLNGAVDWVAFRVDGVELARVEPPAPGPDASFAAGTPWEPSASGSFRVEAVVGYTDGRTASDSLTLTVVDAAALVQAGPQPASASATPPAGQPATAAPRVTSTPAANQPPVTTAPAQPTTAPVSGPQAVFDRNQNVRTGPGTNFSRLGTFAPGDQAEILALSLDGTWYRVVFQGRTDAWVYAPLVTTQGSVAGLGREIGPATPIPPPTAIPTALPPATNPPAPQINLVVENFTIFVPSDGSVQPRCGEPFVARVTIRNTGTAAGITGMTRIENRYLGDGSVNASSENALVPVEIAPGGTHTVEWTFTITTNYDEQHRVVFIADVNNAVLESNEDDNQNGITYTLARSGC